MKKRIAQAFIFVLGMLCFQASILAVGQEKTPSTDLYSRLKSLPGVYVKKIDALPGFKEGYEIAFVQPLDHKNPNGPKFTQRIFLSHRNYFKPVVLETEEYGATWPKEREMVSGAQIVPAFEQIIRKTERRSAAVFDLKPRSEVSVVGGASGEYYIPPAMDGSRPGVFYAQNKGVIPRYSMASLAYHEAVPGHHFQLAIAQELNLPLLRRDMDFTAHIEGWALYAERLAKEMGLYAGDPQGDLGRLQFEAFRAARLVVDTGLHTRRWTFDQAVDFMEKNTGMPRNAMMGEAARYISAPGQATAYCVGFLKILELRERAKAALGERSDLKEFHNILLANGTLPLTVLERLCEANIVERMSK